MPATVDIDNLLQQLKVLEDEWKTKLNDIGTTTRDLCLKESVTARRPQSLNADLGRISARHLLLLIYLPAHSNRSGSVMSCRTIKQIIQPVIGDDVFVVEVLHAAYYSNDDVDLTLLSEICQSPEHWIVVNYSKRVKLCFEIRRLLRVEGAGWVGGADVANALTELCRNDFSVMEGWCRRTVLK